MYSVQKTMYLSQGEKISTPIDKNASCCSVACRQSFEHPISYFRYPAREVRHQFAPRFYANQRPCGLMASPVWDGKSAVSYYVAEKVQKQFYQGLWQHTDQGLVYRLQQRRALMEKSRQHNMPKAVQKHRTIFTTEQVAKLEEEFKRQQYIVSSDRKYLAREIGISEVQIKVWFQNRRIKWRKQQLEAECEGLKKNIGEEKKENEDEDDDETINVIDEL